MTRFLVIGDAILDVTVAPSRPVRGGGDVPAVIRLGPGGQGANVAVRLARRGADVTLAAPVAADAGGRLLSEALTADRVRLAVMPAARSAVVVALLDAAGERSMLSDRQMLDTGSMAAELPAADWIHVSAYALLDDQQGDALASALGSRPADARLSIAGGSIPAEPALVGRFRSRIDGARPDMLVVSRDEAAALLGRPAQLAREAAATLAAVATLVVVTADASGSAAVLADRVHQTAAVDVPGRPVDATGAGDAYMAALISVLAAGSWPPSVDRLGEAMQAGSLAGALAARVIGAQARIDGEANAPPRSPR